MGNRLQATANAILPPIKAGGRTRRAWLAVALAILCGGCVSKDLYPDEWPSVAFAHSGCPEISGIYFNSGMSSDSPACTPHCNQYRPQLTEIFLESPSTDHTRVTIRQFGQDELQVQADEPDAETEARAFYREKGDLECHDGKLWINLDRRLESDIGHLALSSRVFGFVKAEDGSLVAEQHYRGSGVIFYGIPIWWSEKTFVRWLQQENFRLRD